MEPFMEPSGSNVAFVAVKTARLVADGYVIPPDPDTCVVRVPVPREYRSAA
jgi:hypothetical protein